MTCKDVEHQLASFVEDPVDAAVAAHLETCDACRELAHAQRTARAVLQARGARSSATRPPALRTRIVARLEDQDLATSHVAGPRDLAWPGRLTAFAAALMVVLTLGAVLLPVATIRSTAVLAAQFALDHLKCFTIEGDADGEP